MRPALSTHVISASLDRHAAASARRVSGAAALLGLRDSDVRALQQLLRAGELTPGALSRALQLSSGGTTALINRLMAAGLVSRHPHPGDARRTILRPTADAARQTADVLGALAGEIDELVAALSTSEVACLERFLARAADLAEQNADVLLSEARVAARAATEVRAPLLWA